MEFLIDIGGFGIKVFVVTVAFGSLLVLLIGMLRRQRGGELGQLVITPLSEHYSNLSEALRRASLEKKELKELEKRDKEKRKASKDQTKGRVFVVDFHGDMAATGVLELREQISALVKTAGPDDEVVVRVESGGGLVHNYGLAASQLARLREAGIPLTVCVDKVAASGGYLMACVADKILAAPFAILGSIGVIAMVPNINRLLKRFDVDYLELTAGEYKKSIGVMGEITDKTKAKFKEELETTHQLFQEFLLRYRPQLEMKKIATGETWYGARAVDMKLIDEIRTSDDYLLTLTETHDLYLVEYEVAKSVRDRFASALTEAGDRLLLRWWGRLESDARFRL